MAIVILKEAVTFNANVQPLELPDVNASCRKYNKGMVVSGWGIEDYKTRIRRTTLWTVKQQCLDPKECFNPHSPKQFKSDYMLCVGDLHQRENCATSGGGTFNIQSFIIIC